MRSPLAKPLLVKLFCGTALLRWKRWRKTPPDCTMTGPLSCTFPTQLPFFSLGTEVRNYWAKFLFKQILKVFSTVLANNRTCNIQLRSKNTSVHMFCIGETDFLPLLWCPKPHTLSAILGLHGRSLKAAEQQPMGNISQVWWGQVTRLLLQEVTHNILWVLCRAAIQCSGGKKGMRREDMAFNKTEWITTSWEHLNTI